ncbi:MAG: cell envelope integrity protein CreD [Cyclobacteriaceae bacterium]|nr:cell envelope integrity protein CreD [Cyclobacteriaceae bacterium]
MTIYDFSPFLLYFDGQVRRSEFARPDFSTWTIEDQHILWDRAMLNVGISDLRGIEQQVALNFAGKKCHFVRASAKVISSHRAFTCPCEKPLPVFTKANSTLIFP